MPAPSCHDAGGGASQRDPSITTVALVGNPNCGKTTIFNALTGLRQKVGNYPGITVDKRVGTLRLADGKSVEVIDLPGTYSLVSSSPDEQVVAEVLRGGRRDTPAPDVILAVLDASNLARNLFLVSQILDLGRPLVIALNMNDVAERQGKAVDAEALSKALGCPVVPVVGHKRKGLDRLGEALLRAKLRPRVTYAIDARIEEEEAGLVSHIARIADLAPEDVAARLVARRLLTEDPSVDLDDFRKDAELAEAVEASRARLQASRVDPMQADIEARYRWIDGIVAEVSTNQAAPRRSLTERVDAVVMHPVWGLFIFAAIMGTLFVSIFSLAEPLMEATEGMVASFAQMVGDAMSPGPLRDLLVDGVIAGVGAVVVFVPQIALLFLLLAILEDSGYLARAAFLMDRVLSRVGLHGKSFIPLLSSFACAIPGVLATRTIESRRDRLATILVAPFMSCSARLPVYALLIGFCFAGYSGLAQGLVLLGLYLLGILGAAGTAWLLQRKILPPESAPFILELPTYKPPQASQVLLQAWTGTRAFLTRAGTTIFAFSVILWALLYYPRLPETAAFATEGAQNAAQIEYSVAGRIGHALEPAIAPLGYDWKMGIGLVAAFAAREVFVSTLGIVYSVGNADEDTTQLAQAMQIDARPDGTLVWSPLVAFSLMIWFVFAMQCISTIAVVRRETGSWGWALAQLGFMNVLAYVASLGVYQIGARFFTGGS